MTERTLTQANTFIEDLKKLNEDFRNEISELRKRNTELVALAKEREALLDQCVAILAVVRPEIHEQALKRIGISQKDFDALFRVHS